MWLIVDTKQGEIYVNRMKIFSCTGDTGYYGIIVPEQNELK